VAAEFVSQEFGCGDDRRADAPARWAMGQRRTTRVGYAGFDLAVSVFRDAVCAGGWDRASGGFGVDVVGLAL
jgi:hypothetical protein